MDDAEIAPLIQDEEGRELFERLADKGELTTIGGTHVDMVKAQQLLIDLLGELRLASSLIISNQMINYPI